jgi:hypothetical protein
VSPADNAAFEGDPRSSAAKAGDRAGQAATKGSLVSRYWWADTPRVMLPVAIFPQVTVGLPAARVYAAMAMRADNRSGLVDSTFEQIAEDAGMSRRQVAEGVAALLASGWVEQVRKGNSRVSSKYRMRASVAVVDSAESRTVQAFDGGPSDDAESRTVNGAETSTVEAVGQCGDPHFVVRNSAPPLVSPSSSPTTSLAAGETNDVERLDGNGALPLLVAVPDLVDTPPNGKRKPTKNEYTAEFEAAWLAYPRRANGKGSKFSASKEWHKALKIPGVTAELLTAAIHAYARTIGDFPKDAERWFSGRMWEEFTDSQAGAEQVVTFESLQAAADAKAAADLIRAPYADPSQHPSDPTPRKDWLRARRLDWLDEHEHAIRTALTKAAAR